MIVSHAAPPRKSTDHAAAIVRAAAILALSPTELLRQLAADPLGVLGELPGWIVPDVVVAAGLPANWAEACDV